MDYKGINDNEILYLISDNNDYYKEIIFEKYKPIVIAMARQYNRINKDASVDFYDFYQAGMIGLNNAIRFYKPKGNIFYSYACVCIRQEMAKEIIKFNYKKNKNQYLFVTYDDNISKTHDCYMEE